VQQRSGSRSSPPPPVAHFSGTTQAQDLIVSHSSLRLRRLELLMGRATMGCLTHLLADMPANTAAAPLPEGKQGRAVSPQYQPSASDSALRAASRLLESCPRFGDAGQADQPGRSSFQLLVDGFLVQLQHNGSKSASPTEDVACVLCTDAVSVVRHRPPAAAGRYTSDQNRVNTSTCHASKYELAPNLSLTEHYAVRKHRWGIQEAELQEVDVLVAGLAVTLQAAEVPLAASLLLAPQDWDLHLEQNAAACSTAVMLRSGALTACASPAAAQALAALHAALMPSDSSGQADKGAGGMSAPPAAAAQQADDLASGLFSLAPEVAGRPGSPSDAVVLHTSVHSRRLHHMTG
jgi:hypothetical protein